MPKRKILKTVKKGDYNYALVPGHPHATKNGYVLEHRVKLEKKLGRTIKPHEDVHHKNGNKKDNRVNNLEVLRHEDHAGHHQTMKGKKNSKSKASKKKTK